MELVRYEAACRALAEAKAVDEVKMIRDKSIAMATYAKLAKNHELEIDAAEIRIRAERRLGEMIAEQKATVGLDAGGRPKKTPTREEGVSEIPTLASVGIDWKLSARSQAIASIPQSSFETILSEHREEQKAVTSSTIEKLLKKQKRSEEIEEVKKKIESEPIEIGNEKYDVIAIDPPWAYGREYDPETSRVANPYPEMQTDEISKIELPEKSDTVLFLWTTHAFIQDAFRLLKDWGYTYKATIVWDKERMGMGATIRMQCEFCLLAVKGRPFIQGSSERDIIREQRRQHSRKPDAFYEMVDRMCIGRKLDYFSREKRDGWDVFGAETEKF